mmetsp:Transcript_45845/g.106557  ORF Transcript_45845/g.106557 Transcript_45845/m.106557 type:complete len:218 (-) Transcript_45845:1226-1879(-)
MQRLLSVASASCQDVPFWTCDRCICALDAVRYHAPNPACCEEHASALNPWGHSVADARTVSSMHTLAIACGRRTRAACCHFAIGTSDLHGALVDGCLSTLITIAHCRPGYRTGHLAASRMCGNSMPIICNALWAGLGCLNLSTNTMPHLLATLSARTARHYRPHRARDLSGASIDGRSHDILNEALFRTVVRLLESGGRQPRLRREPCQGTAVDVQL